MKNDTKFEKALQNAFEKKHGKLSLRDEQLDELFSNAGEHLQAKKHNGIFLQLRMFLAYALPTAAAAALIAMAIYNKGVKDANNSAMDEIKRLQAQLDQTQNLREEFAKLVKAYGVEVINHLASSGADFESALVVAEENYVRNAGGFREEFKSALQNAKANNERMQL